MDAALTEDPDYFWLDPQPAVEDIQCDVTTDTVGFDTLVFETPVVVDSTINPNVMEFFAAEDSRGGVLEATGAAAIK